VETWTEFPSSKVRANQNGTNLARRSPDKETYSTDDLFRDWNPLALLIVHGLNPKATIIVS
jgi:hypothetical protein